MTVKQLVVSGCICAITVIVPAACAATRECVAGKPTAASYTWNFRKEADGIFQDIQSDALRARSHADHLDRFVADPDLSWEAHADQLAQLRSEINDIGNRLCRLETIRRVVAPWQQRSIDHIARSVQLMADNTEDAILFLDNNEQILWSPTYQSYVQNLFNEAGDLTASVGNAVEYAKVNTEYHELRHDIGVRARS